MHARRRSVFVRVLAVVVGAGLVPLVLATATVAYLVTEDKEAALVDGALAEVEARRQALDRRIELGRAELRSASLAASAGDLLDVPALVGDSMIAVRCARNGDELVEAAIDTDTANQLQAASARRPLTLLEDGRIVIHERRGDVDAWGLLDLAPLLRVHEGWTLELQAERPRGLAGAPAGGVVARREQRRGQEVVTAVSPTDRGLFLTVRAPIAPARWAALSLTREVVLYSLLAGVPLVLLGVFLARAVTLPVRVLAQAVREARDGPLSLPRLPEDEIGDLGAAISAMSERSADDARILRRAVSFSRALVHLRDSEAILDALEHTLAEAFPEASWWVVRVEAIQTGAAPEGCGVDPRALDAALQEALQGSREDGSTGVGSPQIVIHAHQEVLLPLVSRSRPFGVAVGDGVSDEGAVRMAELLCRTAAAAATNHELQQTALVNEKLALLGRLAASVAHEMNNPLAFVTGNLRALEAALEGEQRATAVDAREGAERLARIVQDLSSISRGGGGRVQTTEDLGELAEMAAKITRARRPDVKVGVERRAAATVVCDRGRIEQAILNLVINAADACAGVERPSVRVAITVDGGRARLEVTDNGEGVPERVRPRIFDAFFTTKREAGTGLGLFLSRSFVQADDGELALAATGPGGTTFRIELPSAHPAARVVEEPPATGEEIPSATPGRALLPVGARVLVLDDEPGIVRAMKRWLGRRAQVWGTTDPQEALELASAVEPDLILCDLNMPRMGGREFIAALRERRPDLADQVVIMTGSTTCQLDCRVLRKPVRPDALEELFADVG